MANTHNKTIYSSNLSYLTLSYYDIMLSLRFVPIVSKDENGISIYDDGKGLTTTVSYEDACILYKIACDVIYGKEDVNTVSLTIPCSDGVLLTFEKQPDQDRQIETVLTIFKDDVSIPFRFSDRAIKVIDDEGQIVTKTIESGLDTFAAILDKCLTEVNADAF